MHPADAEGKKGMYMKICYNLPEGRCGGMDDMTTKEFSLMIDLMVTVSEVAGEGELTRILKKYQQTPETEKKESEQ